MWLFRIVLTLIFLNLVACTHKEINQSEPFNEVLAVFPFKNETGNPDLDWLSIGLQENLTIDLWYVSAVTTLSLPDLVPLILPLCTTMELSCVANNESKYWQQKVKESRLTGYITGNYRIVAGNIIVKLEFRQEKSGLVTETHVITGSQNDLLSMLSKGLVNFMEKMAISIKPEERQRILSRKTNSVDAWQKNSQGVWSQLQYAGLKENREVIIKPWERYLKKAIEFDSTYAEVWNNLGWYLLEIQDLEGSKKAFGNSLSIKNDLIDANLGLGMLKQKQKLEAEALLHYRFGIKLNPNIASWPFGKMGIIYENQSLYQEAITSYKRALAIKKNVLGLDHLNVASSLNYLALLHNNIGSYEQAEPLFLRALAIHKKVLGQEHPDTATSLSNLAVLYDNIGAYAQAEPLHKQALAIRQKVLGSEHPDTATSLNNLAILYSDMGAYAQAEPLQQQTLAIRQKVLGPEHLDTATSLNNLAILYTNMGTYAQAKPLQLKALSIRQKVLGPEHPDTATSLHNLAALYHQMGAYAQAEPLYQRALTIREKVLGPEHLGTSVSLNNLAGLYHQMGAYAQAEPLYQRALAITKIIQGLEHPDTAISLNNLALLYVNMGAYNKAEPLFLRALAITEKVLGQEHPGTATSLNNLAFLYDKMAAYDQAEPLYHRALVINENILGSEHLKIAFPLKNLAILYTHMGAYNIAEPLYQRALTIREKVLGTDHPDTANILFNYAIFLKEQSHISTAIFFGKRAVNSLQGSRVRNINLPDKLKQSFIESKEHIYQALAEWLVHEGRLPEAEQVLTMLKEEEYFDFIRRDATSDERETRLDYRPYEQTQLEHYDKIKNRLVELNQEYTTLDKKASNHALSETEEKRYLKLEQDLDVARTAFLDTLDQIKTAFDQLGTDRTRDLGAMQLDNLENRQEMLSNLGHGAVIINSIMTNDTLHLLLTTPNIQLHRQTAIDSSKLNRKIQAFRAVLQNPQANPKPLAQELYRLLVKPIEKDLQQVNAHTLMWSLDSTLRYIPIAALHDGTGYLAQRYALVLYTAAARDNLQKSQQRNWLIAGMGVSESFPPFSSLPAVPDELESIVQRDNLDIDGILPGVIHLDQAFTPDSFKDILKGYRTNAQDKLQHYPVLHIASHFKLSPGDYRKSYLLLGDGSHLTLEQLRTRNRYKLTGVDLLTLSACNTAIGGLEQRGNSVHGREVEGFATLAQKRGAKSVLATLWSVSDSSTGLFMQTLYQRIKEDAKITKAEALRQVQLQFIQQGQEAKLQNDSQRSASPLYPDMSSDDGKIINTTGKYSHPYYWAPFILMGNWL